MLILDHFKKFTNLVLDDDMIRVASERRASCFGRFKTTLSRVVRQTKMSFSSTLWKPTVLMIFINFSIQFG